MRDGFLNLLFSPLLFYSLAWIFTSRSTEIKDFSLPSFLYLPSLYLFSQRFFSHAFNFSHFTSSSLVINKNHLECLTAEENLLSSYRKQNTDLRTHIKCSLAPVQVNGKNSNSSCYIRSWQLLSEYIPTLYASFTFQQIFRGKTISFSTESLHENWIF